MILVNTKDKIPALDKSGVYFLKCAGPCYVCQTGRTFSIITKRTYSETIEKLQNCNNFQNWQNTFDPENDVKYLHICSKSCILKVLKSIVH